MKNRRKLHVFIAVGALLLVSGLALSAGRITQVCVYHRWETKQIAILKRDLGSGNGLMPDPEQNSDYTRLVELGISVRPLLLARLRTLSATTHQADEVYLVSLKEYIAYAISDISGWPRSEMDSRRRAFKSLAECVLARCQEQAEPRHGSEPQRRKGGSPAQ